MTGKKIWVGRFLLSVIMAFGLAVSGCSDGAAGMDGAPGADGADGVDGEDGEDGLDGAGADSIEGAIAAAKAESCGTCHDGAGDEHQEIYEGYVDESALELTIDDVRTTGTAPNLQIQVDFTILDNGELYNDPECTVGQLCDLPSLDQKYFIAVQYNRVCSATILQSCSVDADCGIGETCTTTRKYLNAVTIFQRSSRGDIGEIVLTDDGEYTATVIGAANGPEPDGHAYGYVARGVLLEHEGGAGAEIPAGSHVHLYEDVSNAAFAFGAGDVDDQDAYVSDANVAGCEKCHGVAEGAGYLKHGYRAARVDGIPDFAACKSCHYDDRGGNHTDWQYMVDQPLNWATAALAAADVRNTYAYLANVMNDTHMSHAMEFPYPMSMSNCATCHDGARLDEVLDNSNFTWETCVSCHSVLGTDAWPEESDGEEGKYYQAGRAPALTYLWTDGDVLAVHQNLGPGTDCTSCHGAPPPGPDAPEFDEYHTGYDVRISDSDGNRYADTYEATIGNITLTGNSLRIEYGTTDATVDAEVLVSFYGWDSKDFLVASHQRDGSTLCTGRGGDPAGCRFEYESGDTNPLFTEDAASAPGAWIVTANLAAFQAVKTDSIPDLITSGQVKKAEITVTPTLTVGDDEVGLDAVTQTFDLGTGMNVDDYFKGDNAIVDVDKCNVCHDQLAVTFHSGSGRGGDIVACRNCHNPTFDGSHLEMNSRATENYVHSIHTFQAFDTDDVFEEFDPVFSKRYEQHIHHVFPNFTIRNCEGCHFEGTYNVPDQAKSMPGVLSESYDVVTWYEMVSSRTCSTTTTQSCASAADCPQGTCSVTTTTMCSVDSDCPATETCDGAETCVSNIPSTIAKQDPAGRNLGNRDQRVTGPASRACGACHRARFINQDQAGALASFDAHTQAFGTYVPNDEDDEVLYGVIDKIMSIFE